jgi:tetratricopeptide (TPR) repeat protein
MGAWWMRSKEPVTDSQDQHGPSSTREALTGIFAHTGEYWTIGFAGTMFNLKGSKGLHYIERLLRHSGDEFHVLDLASESAANATSDNDNGSVLRDSMLSTSRLGDSGEVLDVRAKQEYKRRLGELHEELEELQKCGLHERAAKVESEVDFLEHEITRAVGLGGRNRRTGSAAERARLNVTRLIRTAIAKISEHNRTLAESLDRSIRTGSFCSYFPDPRTPISWQFSLEETARKGGVCSPAPLLHRDDRYFSSTFLRQTRFVGREGERARLRHYLDQVLTGVGAVVLIAGTAGVGKTRLVEEFSLEAVNGVLILRGACYDRTDPVPFVAFVEMLEAAISASNLASIRDTLGDDIAEIARLLPQLRRLFPDTGAPLELPPEQSRRFLFNAVARVLARMSTKQPLLLLLDDLHWADEGTLLLVSHLGQLVSKMPVLIVGTYRDFELQPARPLAKVIDELIRGHALDQLILSGLPMPAVAKMIEALGGREPPDQVTSLIHSQTEGIPFFIEELFQLLVEQDRLLDENGEFRRCLKLDDLNVPRNLQLVIGRRIARLSDGAQKVIDKAAVIGRAFTFELLQESSGVGADSLLSWIEEAETAGLIDSTLQYPAVHFRFSHELVRQTVISALSTARRQRLHLNIAEALELLHPNDLEEHAEDLAYHFRSAGAAAEPARAIRYLQMAGKKAQRNSAFKEAQQSYDQALALLSLLPDSAERDRKEIAIHRGLGDIAIVMSGYAAPEYVHHLTRRHELAQRLGDTTEIFYSLVWRSVLAAFRLELNKAQDISWKLLELADHEHDAKMQLEAHGSIANILWLVGDFIGSFEHAEKGLALFADKQILTTGEGHWQAACQFYACMSTVALGFPDKGLQRALEFLSWARERAQPLPLAFALNGVATILAWRGEGAQALKYADAQLAVAAEHGFSNWHSFGQLIHGHALALLGRSDEAIAEIETAFDSLVPIGAVVPGWAYANLALSYLAAKRPKDGLRVAAKGLETADHTTDAHLYRLHGELLLMSDSANTADAETSFRAAIDMACKQCAKYAELGATTSLARLLAKQGHHDKARAMLAEIYNWFTEGFGTADLKEAKALLHQLSLSVYQ